MAIIQQLPQVARHLVEQLSYVGLVIGDWLSDTADRWPHSWPHSWPHRIFTVQQPFDAHAEGLGDGVAMVLCVSLSPLNGSPSGLTQTDSAAGFSLVPKDKLPHLSDTLAHGLLQ
jgi:hypothetical protein